MRILSISTQKPHSTGSGTYLTEVASGLDRMNHQQAVVAGIYADDVVDFPESVRFYPVTYTAPGGAEGDIPFPVVGMSDIMPYTSTRYSDLTEEMINTMEAAFLPVIERAIRELSPDIILCHHLFLLTAMVRKHFPDEKVYGLCHGSDLRQMQNLLNFGAGYHEQIIDPAYIRSGISALDRIYALHGEQIPVIMENYGAEADRVRIIGTGYNSALFHRSVPPHLPNDPIRIICAGKVCREKGIAELLHALDNPPASVPPFELIIIGGCRDDRIKAMFGIPAGEVLPAGCYHKEGYSIRYLGFVTHEELAESFRTSDLFILPSYFEGLPLVLVEAMASGLETICNDLPGVREWLESAVPGYNTEFVALPRMVAPDVPEETDLPDYIHRLRETIFRRIRQIREHGFGEAPDTSGASWDQVAKRILE